MFHVEATIPTLPTDLGPALQPSLQQLCAEVVAEAQEGWPVKSGDSLRGFHASVEDGAVVLGNDEDYAEHVQVKGASRPAMASVRRRVGALVEQRTEEIAAAVLAALKEA
jgi:hypothetical protein